MSKLSDFCGCCGNEIPGGEWRVKASDYAALERVAVALRDALQNLSYLAAHIYPPPYGHRCMWCGDCTRRAKDEARAALSQASSLPEREK
jgi:hypothetical protein